ncbi:hypothetical protein LOTGIDRAFT_235263 [Lottia gigantea]|uniref:TRP C-terminal domain-containing protein n=1 Tax=Lottia gigantea TaxID=225164 RepID=V3ZVL1_LOTGI|nr:hypothetical protein LOTGIDRAFT_235263 [Lottia gigantea]ESO86640.1 hypothetical protein LOTGIDRAFT_235263 [Lottia gigantea]
MDVHERIHCLNITRFNLTGGHLENQSVACISCFFPQNCQPDNQCLPGTTGLTCESCDQTVSDAKYFLFGNSCIPCEKIPWTAVTLGLFLLIVLIGFFLQGFTPQYVTKLKIMIHFFQLLISSIHVKTNWPPSVIKFISIIGFGKFTASVVDLRCMVSTTKDKLYIEWLTALCIPTIIIIIGLIINNREEKTLLKLRKHQKDKEKEEMIINSRLKLRRFLYLIVIIYLMPIIICIIRSFSCTSIFDEGMVFRLSSRDIFLYDNTFTCDSIIFQTMNLLLFFYLIACLVFVLFCLIIFPLRQNKWDLLESQENEYGFVYESYKKRSCVWDALPKFRILISLGLTDTLLLHPVYQSIGVCCLTVSYLLLLLLARPYRCFFWKYTSCNNHLILDILCNIGIVLLQTGGLLTSLNLYPSYLDYIIISVICIVIIYWVILMLAVRFEKQSFLLVEISANRVNASQVSVTSESVTNTNYRQVSSSSTDTLELHQTTAKRKVSTRLKSNKVANITRESESFDF